MKLLLLWALLQPAPAEKIHYEHGFSAWEACNLNASKWPPELVEDAGDIDADFIEKNVERWFDRFSKQGATMVGITVFDSDAMLYMTSPTLVGLGMRNNDYGVDLLELCCRQAAKKKVALDVGLEGLPRAIRRGGRQQVLDAFAPLAAELAEYGKKAGVEIWIDENGFDEQAVTALAKAAADNGVKYYSFGFESLGRVDLSMSKDYATYPRELSEDRPEFELWREISKIGVTGLGTQTLVFASQQGAAKKAGIAVSGSWGLQTGVQQNVALFRAVQFSPALYSFVPGWMKDRHEENRKEEEYVWKYDYDSALAPLVKAYGRTAADAKKPAANLIVLRGSVPWAARAFWDASLMSSLDMVTNALSAAGYEIVATQDPLATADLYYLLVPGRNDVPMMDRDLPNNLLKLLDGPARVVVHAVGLPGGMEAWDVAARRLGLPERVAALPRSREVSAIPEKVAWTFPGGAASIRYRGYLLYSADEAAPVGAGAPYHIASDLHDVKDATVLASGSATLANGQTVTVPVLTERKGKFFVNGNFVHLEFSSALANAISREPVFHRPAYAYVTVGPDRSAVFAADDTGVDLALPAGTKVAQFDPSGKAVASAKVTLQIQDGRLVGTLKKWELAIVTK